ncbi:TolC family protein [Neolewinella sp.]|uniref:TolC family protein n=1 Tax=Neolewinella sp. TaxID=2993543 RepID=UPI003B51D6CE
MKSSRPPGELDKDGIPLRYVGTLRFLLILFFWLVLGLLAFAQTPLRVTMLSDAATAGEPSLDSLIGSELEAILASRYQLDLGTLYTGGEPETMETAIQEAYRSADVVVATGLATSTALMERGTYARPSIAAVVLAAGQRGGPEGTGVENFTFIQSPFDIGRDLRTLRELVDYDVLTVLTTPNMRRGMAGVIDAELPDATVRYVEAGPTAAAALAEIDGSQAVYLTPLTGSMPLSEQITLLDSLADRGVATFSLLDQPLLSRGALAAYSSTENLEQLPRRVALDALRIMDGLPAAGLSTELTTYTSELLIDMAVARRADIYPNWETLSGATLLNPNDLPDARTLTLEGAVLEGLANNLGYDLSAYDVALAVTEVDIARSDLLPQLEVATTVTRLDGQTVASSFGQQGQYNWTANGTLNQVILSEPAFANVAINRFLLEGQQAALEQTQLDVVLDVATAYLNVLQSKVFADLQNENLAVTRANLNSATTKQKVGAGGATDVYRWESELALNKIEVNNAQAQLAQARYNLNQLLNRPINEDFQLPDFTGQDTLLGLVGQTILPLLNSPRDLDRLANFLADEARRNLPALDQLDAAINAQERQLLSAERAFYLPRVAINGQYNYRVANYGTVPLPEDLGFDFASEDRPRSTYTLGLNVAIPIFQGGRRKFVAERARVSVLQAQTQRQDLENQLLQRLYSDVETMVASYRNLNLARQAAETSTANFRIIEDLYRAGATNVTSLVDAQNVTLQSNINATNAGYQFVADFIALQRSTGSYQFLSGPAEQTDFLRRFIEY